MKIDSILVIADKQNAEQKALLHSASMAAKFGASLHIVAFIYEDLASLAKELDSTQVDDIKAKLLLAHQQWLNHKITELKIDANLTSEVVWEKDISRWVKQQSKTTHYDLIVKTGHRSEGAFYVPTDWHLMRNGVTPVMLVAEKKWRKKRAIMVALDMATQVKSKQALNQKLVDAAATLGTITGMPVHYCCSVAISPVLKDLGLIDKNKTLKRAKELYMPALQKMLGENAVSTEQIHIKAGDASTVIPSLASKVQAELVVIGSVGRKGVRAKLMGNTAESVLALLKTDVLIIQP
ncbi:universal stress protein [Flavobacterium sp. W21_SRS_FM6]|uniref:universal stress protein n=1 Tax=Flavobacterium sp. W21_SRS_FM6 TaxID=3240268 RepID=UPI003F904397